MERNLSSRLTVILIVLLVPVLFGIFGPNPLDKLLGRSEHLMNLKPGIDIQGGTRLVYEIKAPDGPVDAELSQRVADALKKRVDPDGVKNLVWRPQGPTRLEIQMPSTRGAQESLDARARYSDAQRKLEDTNIRVGQVRDALKSEDAAQRPAELARLAMGSPKRTELFAKYGDALQKHDAARKTGDPKQTVDARRAMEAIEQQIEETNLSVRRVEADLELMQASIEKAEKAKNDKLMNERRADRQARIQAFKADAFPVRAAAVDNFVKQFDEYSALKGRVDDAESLKRLLRGSGVLEFFILVEDPQIWEPMAKRLREEGPTVKAGDTTRWLEVDRPGKEFGHPTEAYGDKQWTLVWTTPDRSMKHGSNDRPWGLKEARPDYDPQTGRQVVSFEFDGRGAALFGELSGSNIKRPLAISLDEKIISAPTLQSRIEDRGQISGSFTKSDIDYMIRTLNAGSLPARLSEEPIMEQTIGPSLGRDNLYRGFVSAIAGVVIVTLMMVGYYYFSGLVATVAVMMNLVIIIGVMAMFNATFTLPGIAALVLTIGMAVDANVLIYERLREEQLRGLSIRMALRNAYDRAFSAIFDSNLTTIATSLILYWFGSEEVKGFGLTLAIGVTSSMFTSLYVTRFIFDIWLEKLNMKHLGSLPLTFPKWNQMMTPKVDWMGKAWIFYTCSTVVIVAGLIAYFAKGRDMYDIEFVSGTSVLIETNKRMERAEVDRLVTRPQYKEAVPAPQVVAVGDAGTEFEIITPNQDARKVRPAILDALQGLLQVQVPSEFRMHGQAFDAAVDKTILPVGDAPIRLGNFTAHGTGAYSGGLAVLLDDIRPKLTPAQIEERIERVRLEPGSKLPYLKIQAQSPLGREEPTDRAIVLISQPETDYAKDMSLAAPVWELVNGAIARPADLKRVTNFDPQVATTMVRDALVAIILSAVVIAGYIWLRFGNLKYGTATVISLVHDVLMTMALIGLAHYAAVTAFGSALLIEPFRINLTMVAAILTVMGYSVNDTIVVFDRIRENRGKFGHINRSVINDSINQTFSRTILTGGTTIVTLFVMYVWGGPSIHGFTFALLGGILIGTYSSIAIATPLLLLGGKDLAVAEPRPVPSAARSELSRPT